MRRSFECSIVIVTFNCWEYVIVCLQTIANQTLSPACVYIVNNGKAPTVEQAAQIDRYDLVTIIEAGCNIGFASGCNLGVAKSGDSDWLILLNPDTRLPPKWIETMHKASLDNPDCAAFGSRLVSASSPEILDGDGDVYHFSGLAWRENHGLPCKEVNDYEKIFSPCAAAAMFKREVYNELNGLDEDFFCYLEDVDFGFRLLLSGRHAINVNACPVLHEGSAITGYRSDFYLYHGQRNIIWVFLKNVPFPLIVLLLPFHLLVNIAGLLKYIIKGKGRVVGKAKLDAIFALRGLYRKRREVQSSRIISQIALWNLIDKRILK